MKSVLFGAALLVSCFGYAHGQISNDAFAAYNDAVRSGSDRSLIVSAAENLAAEAISNPDDPIAGVAAFESAWMLCVLDQCDRASQPAELAAGATDETTVSHASQSTRDLLVAYVDWKIENTRKTRNALDTALESLPEGDVSLVSVRAYREYYTHCARNRRWYDAERVAKAASEHMDSLKADLLSEISLAKLVAISASAKAGPSMDDYESALALERDLSARRRELEVAGEDMPEILSELEYRAMAWQKAISAYLRSTGKRRRVDALDEAYSEDIGQSVLDEGWSEELCGGDFDFDPPLRYPRRAAYRGEVGSVIMGLSIVDGIPENIVVHAAVPDNEFGEVARETLEKWRWIPSEGVDLTSCSMSRDNIVVPFVFQLLE
ncbi:MAG: energy transducer TonB [Pseudomonadota bacterium]